MYATSSNWYIILGVACLLTAAIFGLHEWAKKRKGRTRRPKQK
jgi:hypothetical protein